MRLRTFGFLTAIAMVATACITEQPAIFITLDQVLPDTVSETDLDIRGAIVRDPTSASARFTVMAITTNPLSVDTQEVLSGSAGVFDLTVPIARDTVGVLHQIVITATEEADESLSDQIGPFQVVGIRLGPALRWENR